MDAELNKLPLSAFEHYMWVENRAETPMNFFLKLSLSGELNREHFEAAVQKAITRHPLLQSLVIGKPHWTTKHLYWQRTNGSVSAAIDWRTDSSDFEFCDQQTNINITEEIGVRLFVRVHNGDSIILSQFHHAAVDARGATRFLEDVLVFYHGLSTSSAPETWLRPVNPDLLKSRNSFHISKEDYRKRRWIDWKGFYKYFRTHPERIGISRDADSQRDSPKICHSVSFSIADSNFKKYKVFAKDQHVTMNDLLLRDLFLVLHRWISDRKKQRVKKQIRIIIPIDLRNEEDEQMPATNLVSLSSVDQAPQLFNNPDELLKSINTETNSIKNNRLGFIMIRTIRFFGRLRYGLCLLMCPSPIYRCHTTAIFSNLGFAMKSTLLPCNDQGEITSGGLTLKGCCLMPPFRPGSPLAVGACTVGNRLQITLHFNPKVISQEDIEELRNNFEKQVFSSS